MSIYSPAIHKASLTVRMLFVLFCACFLLTINNCFASISKTKPLVADSVKKDMISLSNAHEIGYQAVLVVQTLESVLNSITFNDNTATELQAYISNSFTPGQRSRVFFANSVIIEDDLNPKFELGKNKDVAADKYLNDLDLSYEKTPDASIKFSNFAASSIKHKDYIYINVKFDESFGSKYKPDGSPYPVRHRIAEVRAEKRGAKHWDTFIVAIRYFDPADSVNNVNNAVNAVPVVNSDTMAAPTVFKEAEVETAMASMVSDRMSESKKEHDQFLAYVASGDALFKTRQYRRALDFYVKAEAINPLSPTVYNKIGRARRLLSHKRKVKK